MSAYRPLNVKDALTYLDQVKVQFSDQPEVYNRFLDIMKDFKSQTIDTPGVIDRVSSLFKGHPSLIQGFNTFLPPGYHIECSNNPHEPNTIRVTTPSGITSTSTEGTTVDGTTTTTTHLVATNPSQMSTNNQATAAFYPPSTTYPPTSALMPALQTIPQNSQLNQQTVSHYLPAPPQALGHNVASTPPNQVQGKRGPVEFNHAINYVNKIKNRFSTEPDTYKQFLEILQTYQKEQKPIQDVYSQVQILFKNAPDLLDEFKQFLPDTSGNVPPGGLFGHIPPSHGPPTKPPHQVLTPVLSSLPGLSAPGIGRLPPVGNFPQSQLGNETFKKGSISSLPSTFGGQNNGAASSTSPVSGPNKKKRTVTNSVNINSQAKTKKSKLLHKSSADNMQASPILAPVKNEQSKQTQRQPASNEEILFFEKVKKFLGNKTNYTEFLKVIGLYTYQILDAPLVVDRMRTFIGTSPELFEWFKQFIKYDDRDEIVQNTAVTRPRLDLESCKAFGPSYRKLPDAFRVANMPSSGMDAIAREVLNDEWVSYPTWASEDGGFISHKKNIYEEALHKCEEERYEYDMFIYNNLNTIALLEPIARKIAKMHAEEKARFKLQPGLGGQSMAYQRVIKKVYDGDKLNEVLEALHSNPAMAVPVILRRLKQKDEEWRRAQREWNKIWREVDMKNYHKSLDHQGITFKNEDKKTLATKTLISDIESIRREPREDGELNEYQYKFVFNDVEVFKDCARVLFSYIERSGLVPSNDRDKIEKFFKSFVMNFFELPASFFDGLHEDTEMLIDHDEGDTRSSKNADSSSESAANAHWIQMSKPSRDDLKEVVSKAGIGKPRNTSTCFFGNSHYYCFFRYLQLLFSRLEQMKNIPPPKPAPHDKAPIPAAVQLGLREPDLDPESVGGDPYLVLLELIDKFFDAEYDNTEYEDRVRQIYGTKAYIMFTVDKLVSSLVKQISTIINDQKSNSLLSLFNQNTLSRSEPSTFVRSRIMYQLEANNIIGYEDHTYRIDYRKDERAMSITLSGRDGSLGDAVSAEERWAYYVYSYMNLDPTDGASLKAKRPFLSRNLPIIKDLDTQKNMKNVSYRNNLEIKIRVNSYHVFFVNHTEDSFARFHTPVDSEKLEQDRTLRKEKWNEWLKSKGI
ncbi:154_t:CDS:10 [Ambispora leptoticha]|uniref:154_t:CDS:1 n=1 Tax=Ambispora leptoticha TaxID=144679 RepID=A0A9N9G740_9GLOM|nr:154_t:CDS:10 [Ambispora leptoticha]